MGKAQIAGGGTDGLYSVTILHDRGRALAQIAKIDVAVLALSLKIITLTSEIATQQAAYDAAKAQTSPVTPFSQLVTMITAINAKKAMKEFLELETSSKLRTKWRLQGITPDVTVPAWCADLTKDLSGLVGTIEPNGEPSGYIILPGYVASGASPAVYSKARDGQIQPLLSNTPEGTFFNKAMMPGWQKWMPTFRVGTILTLNKTANTCTVALDSAISREQGLGINLSMGSCPVEYMT